MGFNLRGAILANIQGSSEEDVEATITDAISRGEEELNPSRVRSHV